MPKGFALLFAQRLPEGCLVVANIANFEAAKRLSVQMLDPVDSSPKWRQMLSGNAFGNDRDGPGWGTVKGVLWMQGTDGWEMWYSRNYGINLAAGTVIWNEVYGSVIRVDALHLVMTKTPSNRMFADAQELRLTVFDFDQKKLRDDFVFTIPDRPDCGDTTDFPWETAVNGGRRIDQLFLYALRRDACESFIARFDWHGAATQ